MDKDRKFAEHYGMHAKRLTPVEDVSAEAAKFLSVRYVGEFPKVAALADKNRDED